MNISVKRDANPTYRVQMIKSITGIALTLILTSTVHWPNIMLDIDVQPVILEPMIDVWPSNLTEELNLWLR